MLQELNLAGNKIDCCLMSDYFTRLVNERYVQFIVYKSMNAIIGKLNADKLHNDRTQLEQFDYGET